MQPRLIPEPGVTTYRVDQSLGNHDGIQPEERSQFTHLLTAYELNDI